MKRREYLKEYRQKNKSKLNEYHKKYYHTKKKKNKEINDNIKKDVEKLKENFLLLQGNQEYTDINILIIATR